MRFTNYGGAAADLAEGSSKREYTKKTTAIQAMTRLLFLLHSVKEAASESANSACQNLHLVHSTAPPPSPFALRGLSPPVESTVLLNQPTRYRNPTWL